MKLALAYNTVFTNKDDATADADVLNCVDAVEDALKQLGHNVDRVELGHDFLDALSNTAWHSFDLVFNLVESILGDSQTEYWFPLFLDSINVPYTGSKSRVIATCLNKITTKEILIKSGLLTPEYMCLNEIINPKILASKLPEFEKIIIKPCSEDASIGIDNDAVFDVQDLEGILRKVNSIYKKYQQPVLIEEYIKGKEFNVSVLEVEEGKLEVLPVAELCFEDMPENMQKICSYQGKWFEDSREYQACYPVFDFEICAGLREKIKKCAHDACKILGVNGYARVDIRVKDDIPYILEVNSNPCITPGAGFVKAAERFGLSYVGLIDKIIVNFSDMEILEIIDEISDQETVTIVKEGRKAIKHGSNGVSISNLASRIRNNK